MHGEAEARKAQKAAEGLFEGGGIAASQSRDMPTAKIERSELGKSIIDVLHAAGVIATKSEGRRLIEQGGLHLNDQKVDRFDLPVTNDLFQDGGLLVRKGKKSYHKLTLGN